MSEPTPPTAALSPGLSLIRRRRWLLWSALIVYLPMMLTILKLSDSGRVLGWTYAVWFVLSIVLAFYAALARCPRCGNYFHMHGMTLLFWRKCLHCQLHLCADRRKSTE